MSQTGALDKLVNELIGLARAGDYAVRPQKVSEFKFNVDAKSLIAPAGRLVEHHRKREAHHVEALRLAETELRDKGVNVEATGAGGLYTGPIICSGAVLPETRFQAVIDQKLLAAVTHAKNKVTEHRDKALRFEKFHRAFSCCPEGMLVELGVEDVHLFRLEPQS